MTSNLSEPMNYFVTDLIKLSSAVKRDPGLFDIIVIT